MGAVLRGGTVVVVVEDVVDVVVVEVVVEVVEVVVVGRGLSRCDRPEDGGDVTTSGETEVEEQLVTSASAAITAPINRTRLAI
jgi:hypothetical protein